jgi:hypothetical protein
MHLLSVPPVVFPALPELVRQAEFGMIESLTGGLLELPLSPLPPSMITFCAATCVGMLSANRRMTRERDAKHFLIDFLPP